MAKKDGWKKLSRRKFISGLARGLGAAGLVAGCDPGSYWDYLTSEDADRVNDRFNETMAGHTKQLVFPESNADSARFLWTSDIHITEGHDDFMDRLGFYADRVGAELVLHSGDCVDQGLDSGYQKWTRRIDGNIPVPLFSAIGNHDLYNDGWDLYKKYIGPSVFRFEYGPCEFIFIDAAAGTLGEDQMHWLEKMLHNYEGRNPARFVLGHYPIYEGEVQTPASMGNTQERMMLTSLFDDYNVDYYLCGHKHTGFEDEVRDTVHLIGGAGSSYKEILGDDYHFWSFDVTGGRIHKKKVYFEDMEMF